MKPSIALAVVTLVTVTTAASADPPTPSGQHPRLYMSAAEIAGYTAQAMDSTSPAAAIIAACQDTIDNPQYYVMRGGDDADTWPGSAVSCAFAYRIMQRMDYLQQAIMYLQASLSDDQTLGDGMACAPGVSTNWQAWAAAQDCTAPPPILQTITHDTGYPMRWYGPDVALAYDWLNGAPGVSAALLSQTVTCLTAWLDYYSQYGYHNTEAGANYNAGYVIAAALGAVAIGNDDGADGHLWTHVIDDVFGQLLVGTGLAGLGTPVGMPAGAMVGGDWLEGWQYGPLSVKEYAVAARTLETFGQPEPEMDTWTNSLVVRYIYGTVPTMDGQWVGGDFESTTQVYESPNAGILDAVRAGPSDDTSAAWAASMMQQQNLTGSTDIYGAIAALRQVTPQDYTTQTPAPQLWYLSRGSRAMYVRTSWDQSAFWGVFSSAPAIVSDHEHNAASNFVFSRGADHLIVDPSQYGTVDTFETNAVSALSPGVTCAYAESQTSWSTADLPWARAADSNVFAARSDFAGAFNFACNPSDIPYAHREWVFLPEGEIVTIDRVQTANAANPMYVNFHANTMGTLQMNGTTAMGTVGGSQVAIHAVNNSGVTPMIHQPPSTNDSNDCPGSFPNGDCFDARFNVDIYSLTIPGPYALAINVIDGLGAGEAAAVVGSMNDAPYDSNGQNAGIIGAAVFRSMKQSYVVASSAHDGAAGSMMTYGVPGTSAARHVVFDAPEASDTSSQVTATSQSGRCVVSITAGSGGGFTGHPLMFGVDTSANNCMVSQSTNEGPAPVPDGGGVDASVPPGNDGGAPPGQDAGSMPHTDAGSTPHTDAGSTPHSDGGTTGHDGATGSDGGTTPAMSGCACTVTLGHTPRDTRLAWLVVGLCAALMAGQRRRRISE